MTHSAKRDAWRSKWGFILACIGSAVGMGNIWLFPARISAYGGATFLIPYLIFVVIIGSTGVIGEMAFGRATRSGPIDAFGAATRMRFGSEKPGKLLGLIPVAGSLAMAIGYSVVTGWIFKYTAQSFTGSLSSLTDVDAFAAGVDIGDDKPCLPANLTILESGEISRVRIKIREGRYHQIKRMFQAVEKEVLFLKRLSMGNLKLDETLKEGEARPLTPEETERLKAL